MTVESLITELKQLEIPISDSDRASMLAELRNHPTDIDERRAIEWKRGNIYFHSLQDLLIANIELFDTNPKKEGLMKTQACFVKDLDDYLSGLPQEEEKIRYLFGLVFRVGTSVYWHDDSMLVRNLYRVYRAMDEEAIRPWVMQE